MSPHRTPRNSSRHALVTCRYTAMPTVLMTPLRPRYTAMPTLLMTSLRFRYTAMPTLLMTSLRFRYTAMPTVFMTSLRFRYTAMPTVLMAPLRFRYTAMPTVLMTPLRPRSLWITHPNLRGHMLLPHLTITKILITTIKGFKVERRGPDVNLPYGSSWTPRNCSSYSLYYLVC